MDGHRCASSSPRPPGRLRARSAGRSSPPASSSGGWSAHGHDVEVVTTTIVDLQRAPGRALSVERRRRRDRPLPRDAAALPLDGDHADAAGRARAARAGPTSCTSSASATRSPPASRRGAALARVPYVFEPLGMFEPRLRKVVLKRALDATLYRGVARGAAAVVVASQREARRRRRLRACRREKVRVRGNGFPEPGRCRERTATSASQLGIPADAPVVLYVGRIAAGQGHRASARGCAGAARGPPRDRRPGRPPRTSHSSSARSRTADDRDVSTRSPVTDEPPLDLYPQADVFVLASAGESFGMVAAEAAAAGTPVDRLRPLRHRRASSRTARRSSSPTSAPRSSTRVRQRALATTSCARDSRAAASPPRGGRPGTASTDRRRRSTARSPRARRRRSSRPTARSPSRARARASARPATGAAPDRRQAVERRCGGRRRRPPERGSRSRRREQIVRRADAVGEDERQARTRPPRSRRRPTVSWRESSAKTSASTYSSASSSSASSPAKRRAHAELRASSSSARAPDRARRRRARSRSSPVAAIARASCRGPSPARAARREDDDVLLSQAGRRSARLVSRRARSARSPQASTSIVFAKTRTVGLAPRATTDSRAARADDEHARGAAHDRAARPSPSPRGASPRAARGRGSRRAGRTGRAARGTRRSRACAANVLQPETTTTSGCARPSARDDAGRERIVVAKQPCRAPGTRDAAQEHRLVVRARPTTCGRDRRARRRSP